MGSVAGRHESIARLRLRLCLRCGAHLVRVYEVEGEDEGCDDRRKKVSMGVMCAQDVEWSQVSVWRVRV